MKKKELEEAVQETKIAEEEAKNTDIRETAEDSMAEENTTEDDIDELDDLDEEEPKKKKLPGWIIFVVIGVIALIAIVGAVMSQGGGGKKAQAQR